MSERAEDLLIAGGIVVDGTLAPARRADVRIRDGRIAAIAPSLSPEQGERVFDATGCHVAPGFIESHTISTASCGGSPISHRSRATASRP